MITKDSIETAYSFLHQKQRIYVYSTLDWQRDDICFVKYITDNMIRRAEKKDIPGIISLLHQVNMVHHVLRPDLFKPHTTKYNEQELEALIGDDSKPIFVFEDGTILGHAFCMVTEVKDHKLLQDIKTLYIDDICVDENARGKHVGKALYEYVRDYAQSIGCNNITLNVWDGNDAALSFYRNMGMKVQKTTMEIVLSK